MIGHTAEVPFAVSGSSSQVFTGEKMPGAV